MIGRYLDKRDKALANTVSGTGRHTAEVSVDAARSAGRDAGC